MTRRLLFHHVFYVTGSGYFSQVLFMLRGLVAAHLLGPAAFGVWSAIRLVLVFSSYTDAGSNSAMVQCSPRAEGAGLLNRADAHRRVASGSALIGALVAAFGVLLISGGVLGGGGAGREWLLVAGLILLQQLRLFYKDALSSRREFGWVAALDSSFAVLSTVGCIVGALTLGLEGFLIGLAASQVLLLLAYSIIGPRFPVPAWRFRYAVRLIHIGWPIVASQAMLILLWNVDKLMLWILRSSEELGVYAMQSNFTFLVLLLPGTVSQVSLPHLRRRLGETGGGGAAKPFLFDGTRLLAYLSLPIIGLGCLLLHLPIRWFFPSYAEAIAPGRVMIVASYPAVVAALAGIVLIALSYQRWIMAIRALSAIVAGGAAAGALLAGSGLVGVAAATSAGLVVHTVLAMTLAVRVTGASASEALPMLFSIAFPYLALVPMLMALLNWIPDQPAGLAEDLALSAARCSILLMLLTPLGWHAWRCWGLRPVSDGEMLHR